ncbi:PREDICTED: solute carrier organic anion transporter family member 1B3-like [Crocodylus porosus]|uniref:Solute carrier organic anion transporter family member n=2 Tax=Crocodylia TaxID=1294634 RepID=A0A7M4F100_CROPO|nr:PREDICTED: solute carrier organic anion transporter family member 1B3-like [Crocodylus porosus]XP_019400009.1 PREDICTED: solute carrier organic anion transporter family member 1B3-like [Crocodylus porosus]
MKMEIGSDNVDDSIQEAEPTQPLDDGAISQPAVKKKTSCCTGLKVFLAALSFTYLSKTLSGIIMKSSITQIERRFDIPSSIAGLIDGSFEMGNLLVIAFVSYYGAKIHRPKAIALGCFIMSAGSILTAMPHFFMGYYKYETTLTAMSSVNSTSSINPCLVDQKDIGVSETLIESDPGCKKEASSYMWIYVFLGNMLRGIGETPIAPLGISYLDDFAKEEDAPLYIAILHTIAMIGPMLGFLLGSLCARLYVDIGFVDLGSITITPRDSRWVGAWWLGFIIAGVIALISAIPFCFLPKSLKKPNEESNDKTSSDLSNIKEDNSGKHSSIKQKPMKSLATLKDFFISVKAVLGNRIYVVFLCSVLLQFNSFVGFLTYKPKYMEQQYGQSASKSNIVTGLTSLPAVAIGIFLGGLLMKKYKWGLVGATKFGFGISFFAFLIGLLQFFVGCENHVVAGLTVSYDGTPVAYGENTVFSSCNSDCKCASNQWDPVCGDNGITYITACLAGCKASTGHGKNTVFHNCSCTEVAGLLSGNTSVTLGHCPKSDDCSRKFIYYTVIQVISAFFYALGGTPTYMITFRCVQPELKSLAVGLHVLIMRALAGIPAPVYFGALIDRTCLKWGRGSCGQRGACRIYDSNAYRKAYLGLTAGLRAPSYLIALLFFLMVKKHYQAKDSKPTENGGKEDIPMNGETNSKSCEYLSGSSDAEKESYI